MKTVEKTSLISDAFHAMLKDMGPQKTAQVWGVFVPPAEDYLFTRKKLFAGETIQSLYEGAKKFNKKKRVVKK
jgi:hypothetical protein